MEKAILRSLDEQKISYELYEHPAFNTCAISSAWHKKSGRPGRRVKNLFLRNKNGKQHFLLLLPHEIEYDRRIFKPLSGEKCGLASDDRLWKYLKVKPGAVSPLALIHDTDTRVKVFVEASLMQAKALHLHPGNAEASVQMSPEALLEWLQTLGYSPSVITWEVAKTTD